MKSNNIKGRRVHMEDMHVQGVSQTAYYLNYVTRDARASEIPKFTTLKEFTKFKRLKLRVQQGDK